jgi:hypothetical protein
MRHSVEQKNGSLRGQNQELRRPNWKSNCRDAGSRAASPREGRLALRSDRRDMSVMNRARIGGKKKKRTGKAHCTLTAAGAGSKRWDWNLVIPRENSSTLHVSDPTVLMEPLKQPDPPSLDAPTRGAKQPPRPRPHSPRAPFPPPPPAGWLVDPR